jgi:uncharacterized protein
MDMKCLDTYALIEIHWQNPKFFHLINQQIVITDITMAEFYQWLYKEYDQLTADYWERKWEASCKSVSRNVLLRAVRFRQDNKKKCYSFFDCVGYIFAKENNMTFVTGDKEFKGLSQVEFIRK